jgi:hypothetical protein
MAGFLRPQRPLDKTIYWRELKVYALSRLDEHAWQYEFLTQCQDDEDALRRLSWITKTDIERDTVQHGKP